MAAPTSSSPLPFMERATPSQPCRHANFASAGSGPWKISSWEFLGGKSDILLSASSCTVPALNQLWVINAFSFAPPAPPHLPPSPPLPTATLFGDCKLSISGSVPSDIDRLHVHYRIHSIVYSLPLRATTNTTDSVHLTLLSIFSIFQHAPPSLASVAEPAPMKCALVSCNSHCSATACARLGHCRPACSVRTLPI